MEEPKSKAKRGAKTAAAAQEDKITLLPLSELHDFPDHPFKVRDDAESRNKQNWRDIDMRFLLKILFAPILAVLAVVTWFLVFVVSLSSGILCIPAAILGFFGLFIIFVDSVSYGAGLLVIAFLISPYGLPMLATWLLAKLHVLRYAIQDRIYG